MTDIELLKMALEELEWAKLLIKLHGGDDHTILDDTISAIKDRLQNKDD